LIFALKKLILFRARILKEEREMKTYRYTVIFEADEDGFHAFVPALPGCHSYGKTLEDARLNIAEAISLHIECMQEDGESIPHEREPVIVASLSVPVAA